ncbi:MAG TPA: 3-hydroxyacyl-CoA dehydrogenase family protein [Ohtaekwangia sp.]
MDILIVGEQRNYDECLLKFGQGHHYVLVTDHRDAIKFIESHDLVIDFTLDEEPNQIEIYATRNARALINTAKISLSALTCMINNKLKSRIYGFNGLPTFLNRSILEASLRNPTDENGLRDICTQLNTEFLIVDDRVGMVTPRVICMIINEAYYTVHEGTASREDIDVAMKMGTNYPFGPFEWCQRIGVKHVYELLEALYEDTHDERYKVCPLLKQEYLRQ